MPKFKIPILIVIRAETIEDARQKVRDIFSAATVALETQSSTLNEDLRWWDFAQIRTKFRAVLRAETRPQKPRTTP